MRCVWCATCPTLQGANYADDKDKLDLYLPEGRTNAPVIVSYYGNQLMGGDKSEDAYVGRRFAAAGFVTAVVNYRLSPAVSHPAHVQDAAASFAWVKRHIKEYGGNPDRVFVIGYSAGAYLAALLSTDPRYLAAHKLSPRDIRGVVPVSAFYLVEGRGVAPDRDKSVWGTDRERLGGRIARTSSPRRAAPPMLILYAERDEDWRRAAERRGRGGDEGGRPHERGDRDDRRSKPRDDLVARRRRGRHRPPSTSSASRRVSVAGTDATQRSDFQRYAERKTRAAERAIIAPLQHDGGSPHASATSHDRKRVDTRALRRRFPPVRSAAEPAGAVDGVRAVARRQHRRVESRYVSAAAPLTPI